MSELMEMHVHAWNLFFSLTELSKGDLDAEIQPGLIGTRAFDPLTSVILYIYSMETLLPSLINNAAWEKDESRIDTLGPYALALHEIIYRANNKRHDVMRGQFSVFRGMTMTGEMIKCYVEMVTERESIALIGFTSTHKSRSTAEQHAF